MKGHIPWSSLRCSHKRKHTGMYPTHGGQIQGAQGTENTWSCPESRTGAEGENSASSPCLGYLLENILSPIKGPNFWFYNAGHEPSDLWVWILTSKSSFQVPPRGMYWRQSQQTESLFFLLLFYTHLKSNPDFADTSVPPAMYVVD